MALAGPKEPTFGTTNWWTLKQSLPSPKMTLGLWVGLFKRQVCSFALQSHEILNILYYATVACMTFRSFSVFRGLSFYLLDITYKPSCGTPSGSSVTNFLASHIEVWDFPLNLKDDDNNLIIEIHYHVDSPNCLTLTSWIRLPRFSQAHSPIYPFSFDI